MATVLLLCWRDSGHPQGGGSEHYLETMGEAFAQAGHRVVYRTAAYPGAPSRETRNGILFSRGGNRITVYPRALAALVLARWGRGPLADMGEPDVIIDTQNGVPFFAHLVSRAPVTILEHHCHHEQWPVAGPGLAQLGWWLESRVSPRVHRHCQYITVSEASKRELHSLGVDASRIAVVPNGCTPLGEDQPVRLTPLDCEADTDTETASGTCRFTETEAGSNSETRPRLHLVTLSRLVPHKQLEHALTTLAALLPTYPHLHLDIIGSGWWEDELRQHARRCGLTAQHVTFHGHVTDTRKHQLLAQAHIHLMPSRKEGWGLAVTEAAQHCVPTIGYRSSAGLTDSVVDGVTGLLVDSLDGFRDATRRLIDNPQLRVQMGEAAQQRAYTFSWEASAARFLSLTMSQVMAV